MAQTSSQVKRRGNDFILKMGRQDGARSLGCVNKLLQLRVGHVNETFTDALEVETGVVRSHHRQSPLYASMEGVAYSLMHTAIKSSKAAPKGTSHLDPLLGLESVIDRPCGTLQGSVLPNLGIQGYLQHNRGRGGIGQIRLQACSEQAKTKG
jgi:hypothetical protein